MEQNIERIVKMTFKKEEITSFLNHFEGIKGKIRTFPGCTSLKLIRSVNEVGIFFTYSMWESTEALNNYRNSELFKTTWTYVKTLFSSRAEAWSTQVVAIL